MTNKASEIAISLPFRFSTYGKIADTTEPASIWADRVKSAIGTMVRERVFRPKYGSKIAHQVFGSESDMFDKIEAEVDNVFTRYLSQLTVNDVQCQFDEHTATVSIDITYSLPNSTSVTTNVGVSILSGNAPLTEDII